MDLQNTMILFNVMKGFSRICPSGWVGSIYFWSRGRGKKSLNLHTPGQYHLSGGRRGLNRNAHPVTPTPEDKI
jgi:hypothetical protein